MCTLTIVPGESNQPPFAGVRVVCNRDESRLRPAARPPELRQLGSHRVLMPVDPVAEGTWIAASDAGLIAVLMNLYVTQADAEPDPLLPPIRKVSRGTVIPTVLAADDLKSAIKLAERLHVSHYEPFRLILLDGQRVSETLWSASMFSVGDANPIAEPLLYTSSGLGDDLVATPRRELFEEMVVYTADRRPAQDAFHRHQWPDRQFASVWMTRPEARTQSITWVELDGQCVKMRYAAREGEGDELKFAEEATLPFFNPSREAAPAELNAADAPHTDAQATDAAANDSADTDAGDRDTPDA
jgi:hypothetical protein